MGYYSDIDLEFTTQNSGDIQKDVNEDAVINSLENILSTLKMSRRMLPTFANNLYYYLFEPIDEITAYEIGENVLQAIQTWDNRVKVTKIKVMPNYDENRYDLNVRFRIENIKEEKEIEFVLKKI